MPKPLALISTPLPSLFFQNQILTGPPSNLRHRLTMGEMRLFVPDHELNRRGVVGILGWVLYSSRIATLVAVVQSANLDVFAVTSVIRVRPMYLRRHGEL